MVSENCQKLIHGEVDAHSKDVVASANLSDTNIYMEHAKSFGSKRLKNRAKKPVSVKTVVSSAECGDNSASVFSPTAPYDISMAAKKMSSPLSQINTLKPNLLDTSLGDANGADTNRLSRSEEKYFPRTQVNKSQENVNTVQINFGKEAEINPKSTEVSAAKSRKYKKSNQTSTDETHFALPIKGQKIGADELISLTDRNIVAENAPMTNKKRKPGKSSSINLSNGKDLESRKNIGNAHGTSTLFVDSTQAPSSDDTHTGNSIERPLEHVDGCDANSQVDVAKTKDDGTNFKDYSSPRDRNLDEPPIEPVVNSVQKLGGSEMAVKAMKSSKENGRERNSHLKNSTDIVHKDAKKPTLSTKKEIKRKVSLDNNLSTVAKSSSKGIRGVVNSSRSEKSLLATPASIFWDNSSESSEDSDTSTKAPSNNSSSSSDSEEEDKSVLESATNGADGARGADYGRSKKKTTIPQSKHIDMNAILRSSSRFKKVKASAAQSQLGDTES